MTEILHYAAFTTQPSGGNPAGVVLDAGDLAQPQRQQIATTLGYSETAFLERGADRNQYKLRYFSPVAEVPFCGHATVATAVALAHRDGPGALLFDTSIGEIAVSTYKGAGGFRASLRSVPTHSRPASAEVVLEVLQALRWHSSDLAPQFPPHIAFAGNEHLVLAAHSRQRLANLHYDFGALKEVMERHGWTTVQLVWRQSDHTYHSRNPFPVGGVIEDPATGAAAAAFGGYLRVLGLITDEQHITIVQGEDMGRRSELEITVDPASPEVTVAGSAVQICDATNWEDVASSPA